MFNANTDRYLIILHAQLLPQHLTALMNFKNNNDIYLMSPHHLPPMCGHKRIPEIFVYLRGQSAFILSNEAEQTKSVV